MMITRERLLFFLWSLSLSCQACGFSGVLRDSRWRTVVPVIAAMALAAAALTAFFSVRPRTASYLSGAVFGAAGLLIFLRGFSESLSQTMGGIALLAGAAFLFMWTSLRRAFDLR